ncbi:MAG: hypothetical protein KDJ38_03400 [Gammaproteobacteria bacterium]|nr:hypothetical protein [Gammaproteobacteria bacterium]
MSKSNIEDVYLTISIDTECDHDPNWVRSDPLTFHSITDGMPNRLQPLFMDVGAIPTYLLTVEVLEDDESVAALKSLKGDYEYGTHLHAAFIEPEKKHYDYAGVDSPDFQCAYSEDVEFKKLENLTALFREKLAMNPTSFRAGRYGAGVNTIDALQNLGYKVDTSVTPHIRWTEPNGEVDFRRAPEQPYIPSNKDLALVSENPSREALLEVPVTVKSRLIRRHPRWFRPWFSDVEQMKNIFNYHLRKYAKRKAVSINMMFHSMEVIEKASPYPQTSDDVKRYLDDTHEILTWCAGQGVHFVGLSELHGKFS